jgi:hypothetical protein
MGKVAFLLAKMTDEAKDPNPKLKYHLKSNQRQKWFLALKPTIEINKQQRKE